MSKKSKKEIELECKEFREKERNKIWEQLCSENLPYKKIKFEEQAYREQGKIDKQLFTYDKSLERIKQNGLERHARPQEIFGLIIDGLELKLDEPLQKINEDMLKSYSEWLSCAFERQGNKLIVYTDPEGISYVGDKYVKTESFKFSDKKEFDIKGINSREWIDLSKFNEEFTKYMYGKNFSELPAQMKTGNKRAQVYLPPDQTFWPVGRGFVISYDVDAFIFGSRASRGVVEQKIFSREIK